MYISIDKYRMNQMMVWEMGEEIRRRVWEGGKRGDGDWGGKEGREKVERKEGI